MRHPRRRFLAVCATAVLSGSVSARPVTRERFKALGTEAHITLVGRRSQAESALRACRKEVSAIEKAFSLYDPGSMLSILNRDGKVATDSRFETLMRHALDVAENTGGAFDPTIQPLWRALSKGDGIEQARRLVDWQALTLSPALARFERHGMAASFNGIAQGFAADQVSSILAQYGFGNTLVDMGEFAASGRKQDGPWLLGIREPKNGHIIARVEPAAGAIATSEPRSMLIDGQSHIIDPLGRIGERWSSVTVEAHDAWRADALSTAIAASPIQDAYRLLADGDATRGWLLDASGVLEQWSS